VGKGCARGQRKKAGKEKCEWGGTAHKNGTRGLGKKKLTRENEREGKYRVWCSQVWAGKDKLSFHNREEVKKKKTCSI